MHIKCYIQVLLCRQYSGWWKSLGSLLWIYGRIFVRTTIEEALGKPVFAMMKYPICEIMDLFPVKKIDTRGTPDLRLRSYYCQIGFQGTNTVEN